jgi:hypothetical protein
MYPQGYINFGKNLCHLCYIPRYVNFAKTYVTCAISQIMSILQKPMSLVLFPKLCQFCKYLCHLCYIPRLCQFCKNLCHSCNIPSYVNIAKPYVTCVISYVMSILQKPMSLVLQDYVNFAKTYVTCIARLRQFCKILC